MPHARLLQVHQQRPELRHAQFDIAATLQHQVTLQNAALQRRGAAQLGEAAVVGAQAVEGDDAGDELHRRARLHRPPRLVLPGPRPAVQRQRDSGQGVGRQACSAQGVVHGRGQRVLGPGGGCDQAMQQARKQAQHPATGQTKGQPGPRALQHGTIVAWRVKIRTPVVPALA